MTYIHPSSPTRSKLSIHLSSQKAPSPRVSLKAAEVLLGQFKAAGVPVQEGPYNAAAKLELSANIHQAQWKTYFENDPTFDEKVAAELVESIARVAKKYPVEEKVVESEGIVKPVHAPVYIDEVSALKARMTLGKAAIPVENWSDLGSKL